MPYNVFRHLSAITAVRPKPNDVRCAYQIPWWLTPQAPRKGQAGGGGGGKGGRGAAENFTWGAELIKCIDPNEGEALRRGAVERGGRGRDGWKGGEGQGRGGGRKFYLGGAGFPAGFHLLGGGAVEGLWRGVA